MSAKQWQAVRDVITACQSMDQLRADAIDLVNIAEHQAEEIEQLRADLYSNRPLRPTSSIGQQIESGGHPRTD